jgi:two-component system phosphate regulon sensor histidine kinase PhoR
MGRKKALSDQSGRAARAFGLGIAGRIGHVVMRPFREVAARLRAALWLMVAMGVIMASLVIIAGLSKAFALIGFVSFVTSVVLLPRQDGGEVLTGTLERPPTAARTASAMHAMSEALPDPVIVLNPAGHVLFYNSPREGSHVSSAIRTPEFLDAVAAAPERGRAVTVAYAERVPVGRRMAATVAPLTRGSERGGSILVLLRDLTEVERINQMRADFIANASHELRTPLASLRGFIETLQSSAKGDPGARERFLPIMAEQASRMTRLIDALLSLSRVEMNAHVPPSDLVDLNHVLNHAKDTLEPLARETGFKFEVGSFPRPAVVRGDRDELLQVLQNLVQNAFKYGERGGHVKIEAKHIPSLGRQAGRYAIAVVDNGPGIAPEHLPRLTERFYRVDVASSREKGGTGLGLAIVKHILNRHKGELAIASKPGKGSTFTVMLNEARASHPERGAAVG